jgi:thiamine-monophosphate kinase
MIDTSDGLSTDLGHLCEESGVGAVIETTTIPRALVGRPKEIVNLDLALHGGEDYELLFTSAKAIPARIAGVAVTQVGLIQSRRRIVLREPGGARRRLVAKGWEHFR